MIKNPRIYEQDMISLKGKLQRNKSHVTVISADVQVKMRITNLLQLFNLTLGKVRGYAEHITSGEYSNLVSLHADTSLELNFCKTTLLSTGCITFQANDKYKGKTNHFLKIKFEKYQKTVHYKVCLCVCARTRTRLRIRWLKESLYMLCSNHPSRLVIGMNTGLEPLRKKTFDLKLHNATTLLSVQQTMA